MEHPFLNLFSLASLALGTLYMHIWICFGLWWPFSMPQLAQCPLSIASPVTTSTCGTESKQDLLALPMSIAWLWLSHCLIIQMSSVFSVIQRNFPNAEITSSGYLHSLITGMIASTNTKEIFAISCWFASWQWFDRMKGIWYTEDCPRLFGNCVVMGESYLFQSLLLIADHQVKKWMVNVLSC